MTFDEAWPLIREGKSFRYHKLTGDWSPWQKDLSHLGTVHLNWLMKLEFDIKREPREFTLNLRDCTFTESGSYVTYDGSKPPPSDCYIVKVREVIE